jgi:hypothetical protein
VIALALALFATIPLMPPTRFQGEATVSVHFIPKASVDHACRDPDAPWFVTVQGCYEPGLITISNPCEWPGDKYAQLLCHEKGHALGWPADHPR